MAVPWASIQYEAESESIVEKICMLPEAALVSRIRGSAPLVLESNALLRTMSALPSIVSRGEPSTRLVPSNEALVSELSPTISPPHLASAH